MHPSELNAVITAITNHLYCNMEKDDFVNLGVFLSLLSKNMLSTTALEGICRREEKHSTKK